ncbi:MurR/RpiR family transcriptional regulator [Butyricicoccus faecihominis]|uniref:MurR/RpiR family transcriptional regulator n=1 Tax=Butyricicoccus faecihominis TaxID=1712515 RepID=UPI0024785A59|nr:MurR/RpiR family transcriptional regulator [Butyricicoccus faecihominis]
MTLETLIEQNYHKLSENDLYIWDYIRTHPAQCRDGSIDELAAACSISHTTILRFAKKLGLTGFSELKVLLKWQEPAQNRFRSDEITRTIQDYQQTMEYLCMVDLSDLFTLIDRADKIYIYGSGSVQQLAAQDLKQKFFHGNKLFHTVEGEEEMRKLAGRLGENDLMIFISLSGNNAFVNAIAEQLKQKGRTIVSICRVQGNRLIYLSDINIPFFTHAIDAGVPVELWPVNLIFQVNEFLLLRYLEYVDRQRNGL